VSRARLAIVTGKGGVGKTTVAAALARAAVRDGQRVLLVELTRPGRLAHVLGVPSLGPEPRAIGRSLDAVALDETHAIESLIDDLMPLRALSRRLLSSETFRVISAAVPGIREAATLAQLLSWLERGDRSRGARYDLVVLDSPASGHSAPLFATPEALGSLATVGPLGRVLGRVTAWLADPDRTSAIVVAIPEPWAVTEAIDLYGRLRDELRIPLARPVLNAVFPRRFSKREEDFLHRAEALGSIDSELLVAGRHFLRRRKEAQRQVRALRSGTSERPIELPFLFSPEMSFEQLDPVAEALWAGVA
jgi:anion-transporting  ArsA/GET3 family ATPase